MGAQEMMDLDFTLRPAKGAAADAKLLPAKIAAADATLQPEIGTQRPGKGANFIAYARGGVPRRASAPDAPVLIVEDDEDVRRLLERVLTLEGFPVRTAADGHQFVQAIRQRPLPCLILLDVELPKISGFRLLSFLRQEPQTSAIPVVMVTARSENKDLLQGLSLGADGYLSKPVTIEALRSIVGKVLARS